MQDPTVSQLRDRMREFLLGKWNMPDERLFIYYAGHGFTDFNQASRENNGYITGSDTPRYDLNPGKAIENAVPFTEIDSWNRQTRARHVLMVFDSCFSGTLFQTMGPSEEELRRKDLDGIRRMLGQPIRYYITSGRKEEVVTADSTFATLLLRGLRGEADFFRQGPLGSRSAGDLFEPRGAQTQSASADAAIQPYRQRQAKRGPIFLFKWDSCDEIERRRAPP